MLYDKTKIIKHIETIKRSDSDKLKDFFSKNDYFLRINKIMIVAIIFSLFSFYIKEKYIQLKSQFLYLFLNIICYILSSFKNKQLIILSQIILIQGCWMNILFIGEDLINLSKVNPIDSTKYISLTYTVSIIYYSLTLVKKNYVLASLIINFIAAHIIQLRFHNSELFLERCTEEYGLILFLFFVTFYNRDKIAEMEEQILIKENLQRNMANFYNEILDRTINYHLLVYNNKERIFINKSFNYLISQCHSITKKASTSLDYIDYTEKDIDDILDLLMLDSNLSTSFKNILNEVLSQQDDNKEKDKIIFNGKFSFRNLLYFDVHIRKNFYTENFNPIQIEIYDITAYKKAENKIVDEMDKRQKVFGRIIHEFKTPLIAVSTIAKQVKDNINDYNKIDDIKTSVNQIENITSYISFLISDFIQLSKGESQLSIELAHINLEEICCFCINILKSILQLKHKEAFVTPCLIFDQNIKNYFILCDEVRIKQMLLNFLSNAAKFTKHGSIELICTIQYDQAKRIRKPYLKIVINDTGLGMNKEQLEIINKKKYDNIKIDRKINEFGTGLGISITHQIADALNMDMSIISTEGKGTTVQIDYFNIKDKNDSVTIYSPKSSKASSVTLPFIDAEIEDPYLFNNPLLLLNDFEESKMKILIADDSLFVRNPVVNLFVKVLKFKGLYPSYDIVQCNDGFDVIKEVINDQKDKRIKLILSDNEMEFFNGGETLKILKNLYRNRRISQLPYSICFTADTTQINVDSLLALGFNKVIDKEIKTKDVESIIDNLIAN